MYYIMLCQQALTGDGMAGRKRRRDAAVSDEIELSSNDEVGSDDAPTGNTERSPMRQDVGIRNGGVYVSPNHIVAIHFAPEYLRAVNLHSLPHVSDLLLPTCIVLPEALERGRRVRQSTMSEQESRSMLINTTVLAVDEPIKRARQSFPVVPIRPQPVSQGGVLLTIL